MTMTSEKIIKILKDHGVPYKVEGNQILADSMISGTKLFEKTENVTTWTRAELLTWLGYEWLGYE